MGALLSLRPRSSLRIMQKGLKITRETALPDLLAGITCALSYVPQGMGYAVVAGVSPAYGLYTGVFAPADRCVSGRFFAHGYHRDQRTCRAHRRYSRSWGRNSSIRALFTLTLLIGLIQLVLGLLKLGNLTRFISNCVMTGFISGVAILLVFGQLQKLTGYAGGTSGNVFVKTWDWLLHLNRIDWRTTLVGLLTIAAIIVFQRTRMKAIAFVLALVIVTVLVSILALELGATCRGNFQNPTRIAHSSPAGLSYASAIIPGCALTGNPGIEHRGWCFPGLSRNRTAAYRTPRATSSRRARRMWWEGSSRACRAEVRYPVRPPASPRARRPGGQTFSRDLTLALFLLTIGRVAEIIPMSALAGLLVYIGVSVMRLDRIARVWNTYAAERAAMVATFALTLLIPLHWAIFAGVALTLLLFVYSSSSQVRLVRIVRGQMADSKSKVYRFDCQATR